MQAYRSAIFHCLRDPGPEGDPDAFEYFDDGLLLIENGRVLRAGPAAELASALPADVSPTSLHDRLIVPGFIDTHIHYPQTDVIASYGEQLLQWLDKYTFPAEARFSDPEVASETAEFFFDELLRNGTTTAQILSTVHAGSVDAAFAAAQARGMRVIAGKVLMDRNAPPALCDTPERGYAESRTLIERWHGKGRLSYAITPRFAPTSSDAQLQRAGQLASEHADVFVHTHVAENRDEIAWVASLFPWSRSYLDVYEHYGLLRERTVLAHCLYLDQHDRQRMSDTGATMAFCPTSNLFLGSGLFDLDAATDAGVRVGLATDVGGGTSFSMLRTMAEAYKVLHLNGQSLPASRAFHLATLGGAQALYLDDKIGNFEPGKEADFLVLDLRATPLLARRLSLTQDADEKLFALMTLGDDRCVETTYVQGWPAWRR